VQPYLLVVDGVFCIVCVKTKQPNFNCRTFTSTDIIQTLFNYFTCE